MPTFVHTADGSKTVFNFIASALAKTVRVNGAVVVPTTLTNSAATIAAPAVGSIVEIIYGPLNGADPLTIPTALEQTYKPAITPVVRYWGAGADAMAFTLDMNAKKVDVSASGALSSN